MSNSRNRVGVIVFLGLASLGALGCGSEPSSPAEACSPARELAEDVVGVPVCALCEDEICTSGVTCTEVVEVSGDAELTRAAAAARAGTCIALRPGSYGDVELPGGVSLLGRGGGTVTARGLVLGAGDLAVARGVTIGAGGVRVEPGARVRIEAVRIAGSAAEGINIGAGASVEISASEIRDSARYGVSAFDARSLTLDAVVIEGSLGPGLWAQCSGGCACESPVEVTMRRALLRDNKRIGMALVGAIADIFDVEVSGNTLSGFEPSGGLSASGCATLAASALHIVDNAGVGLLIDGASASLGGEGGFEVRGCRPGVWIQHTTEAQSVELRDGALVSNRGVGLGMSGEARGIVIDGMRIADTLADTTAVNDDGLLRQEVVGDAVSWQDEAQAAIRGLVLRANGLVSANPSVSASPRASMLIDGSVGPDSSLAEVTLEAGDEATGIVQQRLPGGGASPTRGVRVPEITVSGSSLFSVPEAPEAPSGL